MWTGPLSRVDNCGGVDPNFTGPGNDGPLSRRDMRAGGITNQQQVAYEREDRGTYVDILIVAYVYTYTYTYILCIYRERGEDRHEADYEESNGDAWMVHT